MNDSSSRASVSALIVTASISALAAFVLGVFATESDPTVSSTSAQSIEQSPTLGALAEENQRLTRELRRAVSDLEVVKADNAKLLAASSNHPKARADGLIGAPLPRHEIQKSVLDNLRKVMAARDQFQLEHGREPSSIREIVGHQGYFKRLIPVDGEDYASLSLQQGGILVVTTASGITVKYGAGLGANATTQVEYPPEMARVKALAAALKPAANAAFEAYRLANQGKDPDDADALLPFFATPQQRADYLEFREANKAANKR